MGDNALSILREQLSAQEHKNVRRRRDGIRKRLRRTVKRVKQARLSVKSALENKSTARSRTNARSDIDKPSQLEDAKKQSEILKQLSSYKL